MTLSEFETSKPDICMILVMDMIRPFPSGLKARNGKLSPILSSSLRDLVTLDRNADGLVFSTILTSKW